MCMQFRPPDPLPEPVPASGIDALIGELIDLAGAWAAVRLRGVVSVREASQMVQAETERLRCVAKMMEDGV